MKKQSVFSKITHWLKNSELFARPSKQLPGKWDLYEYYTELEKELIHKEEKQLKSEKSFARFEFLDEGKFVYNTNLPRRVISLEGTYTWSIAKNFVTLIHNDDFRNNEEFQFAIDKGNLKLLKKDGFGKINLFGFFRKDSETKK